MLYIKVIDGMSVDHPVMSENLLEVFGSVPTEYKPFARTVQPYLGHFEEWDAEAVQYAEVDGVWTDLWPRKQVSDEKRAEIIGLWKNSILHTVEMSKQFAQEWLNKDSEAMRPHWETYIAELNSFEISDGADLTTIQIPKSPMEYKYDENGNKVTLDMAGSIPNVIG